MWGEACARRGDATRGERRSSPARPGWASPGSAAGWPTTCGPIGPRRGAGRLVVPRRRRPPPRAAAARATERHRGQRHRRGAARPAASGAGCRGAQRRRHHAAARPCSVCHPRRATTPPRSEGRKLNDEITRGGASATSSRASAADPGSCWSRTCSGSTTRRSRCSGELLRERRGDLLSSSRLGRRPRWPSAPPSSCEPLTREECVELDRRCSTSGALDRRARSKLVDRSDGIPLYLEELVRGGGAVDPDPDAGDVPDVLYEPLVARLYSTAHGVPVAAAAAAIGREVDRDLLLRAVDLPAEAVDAELKPSSKGGCWPPPTIPAGCRFRHELLREVAYELQPPSQRRRVHGRVGRPPRADAPSELVDWPVVATHFERPNAPGDAADAYAQASDRARRRGAIPEARAHLARAIDQVLAAARRPRRGCTRRSTSGCGAGSSPCRPRERGAPTPPPTSPGASRSPWWTPRATRCSPRSISLWAYHLSRAELDRAEPGARHPARGRSPAPASTSGPPTAPATG